MAIPPYTYSPISERPPLEWPGGKRPAFYIGLNIEHFLPGMPSTSLSSGLNLPIDPMNHSWRDYGTRVGIWRTIDLLDELGLRASVLLNSTVCHEYPQIIRAGVARNWAWLGHGETNSRFWIGMEEKAEADRLVGIVRDIRAATGQAPKGWLGPAFTETENSLRLLADHGFTYSLDWAADDQPFPLLTDGRGMISVPYSAEINDITAFLLNRWTPEQFTDVIIRQFDVMHAEADAGRGAVMPLCLHPFLVGVPYRHAALAQALRHIASHDDVWFTTSDEIAAYYMAHYLDGASRD